MSTQADGAAAAALRTEVHGSHTGSHRSACSPRRWRGAVATRWSIAAGSFDRCARPEVSGDDCRALQNAALATLIGVSDHACNEHLKSIYGRESGWNIGLGSLATLFSGSAAVVGSTAAKSNHAAASTFFGAERSLANEVVNKNQLVPAVHDKLLEKRQERRTELFQRFTAGAGDHPFRAAVRQARGITGEDPGVTEATARVKALGRLIRHLEAGEVAAPASR